MSSSGANSPLNQAHSSLQSTSALSPQQTIQDIDEGSVGTTTSAYFRDHELLEQGPATSQIGDRTPQEDQAQPAPEPMSNGLRFGEQLPDGDGAAFGLARNLRSLMWKY